MIDEEATQILNGGNSEKAQPKAEPEVNNNTPKAEPTVVNNPKPAKSKNAGLGKAAYAAGGFAAGVAASAATSAMAAGQNDNEELNVTEEEAPKDENTDAQPQDNAQAQDNTAAQDNTPAEDNTQAQGNTGVKQEEQTTATENIAPKVDPADSPSEQDVLLVTDEGLRVAQVDDSKSFAEAFADARSQVGPGGVFEWHGKVYGTYYKDEWEGMSSDERAQWQAKVDYNDVSDGNEDVHYASNDHASHHSYHSGHEHTEDVQHQDELNVQDDSQQGDDTNHDVSDQTDEATADNEIHVLGVETVEGPDGNPMTVAGLQASDGDQALLVDVDNDGHFDVLLHDDNGDGQIEQNEMYDARGMGATVADLQQAAEDQSMHYASNDDMPDYMNDADTNSYA